MARSRVFTRGDVLETKTPLNYNDHDRLRLDPLHALLAGKADVLGEDRLCQEDRGKALAAHSTLNRLELGALGGDTRYKKIIAKPQEIEALLIEEGVKAIPRKSREIILDFDATDDPLHGNQQGAASEQRSNLRLRGLTQLNAAHHPFARTRASREAHATTSARSPRPRRLERRIAIHLKAGRRSRSSRTTRARAHEA